MEKKTAYPWVEFYIEFANKLLAFADNRTPLVDMIKNVYKQIGINLPKLEKDGEVLDIDPFTLFGLFNKGITTENRIKIINAFAEKLGVTAVAPTEFEGVPVLNNQNATYYDFAGKGSRSDDIDNLWKVFTSAVEYADKNTESGKADFIKYYNLCLKQKGVRWNLTIGLYWVRPYTYINLDSRNRWFITNPVNTSADFVDMLPKFDNVPFGEEYLRLCEMSTDLIALAIISIAACRSYPLSPGQQRRKTMKLKKLPQRMKRHSENGWQHRSRQMVRHCRRLPSLIMRTH